MKKIYVTIKGVEVSDYIFDEDDLKPVNKEEETLSQQEIIFNRISDCDPISCVVEDHYISNLEEVNG
tara:strand:+ start:514 stop:714 length:201 start_codon:yes stop_codon:yes gene_type:complete